MPPTNQWTSSLWTAVGTTVASYPADVFVYNPGATSLTVSYATKGTSGTFSVPSKGSYRYEMPLLSGAHFFTTGGEPFVAIGTMDSSVSGADQTYDWGYTLVPDSWLTTAFVAGWAPGTADLTGNGSPVWVTATKPTTIYVDYGAPAPQATKTAPNGQRYDISYAISQFESKQLYGLNNTQTGMKVFTADGTTLTGAWGEDPAKASAGTPYLDVGYTIPPLPEVIISKTAAVTADVNSNGKIDPGDTILYTVKVRNNGAITAFNSGVTDAVPAHTSYVLNSTTLDGVPYADDSSGSAFPLDGAGINVAKILVGESAIITYKMLTNLPPDIYSSISNTVAATVDGVPLTINIDTPINSSATACALNFSTAAGATVTSYALSDKLYVQLEDSDTSGKGPLTVQVVDAATADREPLTLLETGTGTGVFRNVSGLTLSTTSGQTAQDGKLYTAAGDTLGVGYSDAIYGDQCSSSAAIAVSAVTKTLYFDAPVQGMTRVDPVSANDATTEESVYQLGTTSSGSGNTTFSVSLSPTQDTYILANKAGNNYGISQSLNTDRSTTSAGRILMKFDLSSLPAGATITGANLVLVRTSGSTRSTDAETSVYRVTSDWSEGAMSGAAGFANWAFAKSGVSWTAGGAFNSSAANPSALIPTSNTSYTWPITSLVQGWWANTYTNYGLMVKRVNETNNSSKVHTYASRENSTVSNRPKLVVTYTLPTSTLIKTNLAFTQTTGMAAPFSLPSGGTVKVTTYVRRVGTSMPSPLLMTAALEKGGTNFLTLNTNPVVTRIGTSSDYKLEWTGTLPSAVNFAVGDTVTTRLTIASSGVTFKVLYGSSTYPSRVDLPTTTAIKVETLEFYDAAGNVVISPTNGQTVYIRSRVSDPFGLYDINNAVLKITDPANAVTSVTLTDANMVTNTTSSITYQYPWQIPSTQGNYTLTLTANEGLEGQVVDTRALPITVIYQDTGTPGVVEFTSGLNGTVVSSYSSTASMTNQVCLRVTDYNVNQNPAVAETVTVKLRSTKGDPESKVLTETGLNTGIFAACMNRESSAGNTNGAIYAVASDAVTVSYTDPTDPTDVASAAVVLTTTNASLTVGKVLVLPASGPAAVGETVRFDLTIGNPNAFDIYAVSVTDTFPSTCMSFVSASEAPDTASGSTLTWADLGTIASYKSQLISVYFKVTGLCGSSPYTATNSVAVDALNATDDSAIPNSGTTNASATVNTSNPKMTITNVRTSGSGPVSIGSDITFRITLTNTGSTSITTLPLSDVYSDYCMVFKSATSSGTGSGGSVLWSNLGPLAAGANKFVDVTFTATGPCTAQTDASVSTAVDANSDPVPAVSASASVVTTTQPPSITKSFTPGLALLGNPTTLTFVVTNPNLLGALKGISFSDTYPTGMINATPVVTSNTCGGTVTALDGGESISLSDGTIAANGTCSVSVGVVMTQSAPVTNISGAVVSVNGGTGGTATQGLSVDTTAPETDLEVGITNTLSSVTMSQTVNYTLLVTNHGPTDASNAVLKSAAASGLTVSGVVCAPVGGSSTCPDASVVTKSNLEGSGIIIPFVANGESLTFTVTAQVGVMNGSVAKKASIVPENINADPNYPNNVATDTDPVTPKLDLEVTIDDGVTNVIANGATQYVVVVTNHGPSAADGAVITSAPTAGITITALSCGSETGGAICPVVGMTTTNLEGAGIIIPTLPSGASLTFAVDVDITAVNGTVTRSAVITPVSGATDTAPGNNSASDVDIVDPSADLSVTIDDGVTSVLAGGTTSYTIVVGNSGPNSADGALFTSAAVSGLSVTSVSCGTETGSAGCPTTGLTAASLEGAGIAIPTLPNGGSVTFTVAVDVSAASGSVIRTAVIAAPVGFPDPNSVNNSANDEDSIDPVADLLITIDDGLTHLPSGGTTSYAVVVTNNGPSAADGAVFTSPGATGIIADSISCGSEVAGALCPLAGTTKTNMEGAGITIPTLPSGGSVTFTVGATITAASGTAVRQVGVAVPTGTADLDATNNSASDSDAIDTVADVAVTISDGATHVTAGGTTSYSIVVTNNGPSDGSGTALTSAVATGLSVTSVSCGTETGGATCPLVGVVTKANLEGAGITITDLPFGGSLTFTVDATVDAVGGTVTKAAAVDGGAGIIDTDLTNNSANDADTVDPAADLSLTIDDSVTHVAAGGTTSYSIVVTNGGPSKADGAVLTAAAATGLSVTSVSCDSAAGSAACPLVGVVTKTNLEGAGIVIPTLPSGGSVTFTVAVDVSAGSGSVTKAAAVAAPTGTIDGTLSDNSASDLDTIDPVVDLSIAIDDGVTKVGAGGTTTYSIVVTNSGPSPAGGAVLTAAAATGLSVTSVSCGVPTGNAACPLVGVVTKANLEGAGIAIPTLPSGGSVTFEVGSDITAVSGTVTKTAEVTAPSGTTDSDLTNNSASDADTVEPAADLTVTIDDSVTHVTAGGTTSYSIVVTNGGPSKADGAVLTAAAATGLSVTSVSCDSAAGSAACPLVGVVTKTNLEGAGIVIPTLPSGGSVTFTVAVDVSAGSGSVTKTAALAVPNGTTDTKLSDNSASDLDTIDLVVDLSITIDDGTTNVLVGGTTSYTVVVANAGPSPADGAVLSAALASGISVNALSCATEVGGAVCPSNDLTIAKLEGVGVLIPTLPSGGSLTFTLDADITATNGTVKKSAAVEALLGTAETDLTNNSADDQNTVEPAANLSITITNGVQVIERNQQLEYSIVLSNAGPSPADGTVLTIPPVTGLQMDSIICESASGGAVCPPGVFTIAQLQSGGIPIPGLGVGGSVTFKLVVTVTASSGSINIQAQAQPPFGVADPVVSDNKGQDLDPVQNTSYTIFLPFTGAGVLIDPWQVALGYEDMPLLSGSNDYDYNDWGVEVDGKTVYDWGESGAIRELEMTFVPRSRGAGYDHSFWVNLPANTFTSGGVVELSTYDANHSLIATQVVPYAAGTAAKFQIFAQTRDALPGVIANTIEANPKVAPQLFTKMHILFDQPVQLTVDLTDAHGAGLFFDPTLLVEDTRDEVHRGDLRLLAVPSKTMWLWPEEYVRIDLAYPKVVFHSGNPPIIQFPDRWWETYNHCVYDGVAGNNCGVP